MRPIPAPRIGESHGLLRAINQRERIRLDEFVTEFSAEDLFPPDMENGLGRTRQFVSFARAAGLLKEDRGTVELTEVGKRYVRAGDDDRPFEVSEAQAEWLRRQLSEKHMTDSIFHGLAIGLSLLSSVAPGTRVTTLDFGRSLGYLGRAGWDNDNTLQIQGERYLALLRDIDLIDDERALTATGNTVKGELTLPIHMSLLDIAGQLNPGGPDAVRTEAEAEWTAVQAGEAAEPAAPEPDAPAEAEEDEWQDVGPGSARPPAPAVPEEPAPPPPVPTAPPATPAPPAAAAAGPPAPPSDIWETAEPDEVTSAYGAVRPREGDPAPAASAAAPSAPDALAESPPAAPPERPQDAATVITPPPSGTPEPPAPAAAPPPAPEPAAATPPPAPEPAPAAAPPAAPSRAAGDFLDAAAIRAAAEHQGLRLPGGVYANVAAALTSGKHVVLTGPPGSGKTTLALAVAQAAAKSGRSSGAVLVTAAERWSTADTLGRLPREGGETMRPGHVLGAAQRGKWLVVDELDRARLDRAFGTLSTFLAGLPVTLPDGQEARPPEDWRIVATASDGAEGGSPALTRRFAHVAVPAPADADLEAVITAAAGGDEAAAGAARRLLALRELRPLGAGVFADAARHAAERNAIEPADERTLAREVYGAYVERLIGELEDGGQVRLRELVESL